MESQEETQRLVELNSFLASVLLPNNVILVLYLIIGIIGNVTVIYFYIFKMKSKRTHRFFIPALAIVDLLAGTFGSSFALALNLLPILFRGNYLCKFLWYTCEATTLSSGFMLLAIAVERYLKVCKPFGYQMQMKWKRVAIILSVVISIIVSLPVIHFYGEIKVQNLQTNMTGYRCGHDPFDVNTRQGLVVYDFFLFIFALIGAVALTVLYGFVGRAVYRQLKKENQRKRRPSLIIPKIEVSDLSCTQKYPDDKPPNDWQFPSETATPSDSRTNSNDALNYAVEICYNRDISSSNELKQSQNQTLPGAMHSGIEKESETDNCRLNGPNLEICQEENCSRNMPGNNPYAPEHSFLRSQIESLKRETDETSEFSKIVEPSQSNENLTNTMSDSTTSLSNESLIGGVSDSLINTSAVPLTIPNLEKLNKEMEFRKNYQTEKNSEIVETNLDLLSPKAIQKNNGRSDINPYFGKKKERSASSDLESTSSRPESSKSSPRNSYFKDRKPRLSIDMLRVPRIKGKHVRNHFSVYRYSYMFMIITIVFIISFAPRVGLMVQEATDPYFWSSLTDVDIAVHLFLYRMYIINHIANPFIYGSFDSAFRKKLWKFFCRSRAKHSIASP